jgi:hypothetical protein
MTTRNAQLTLIDTPRSWRLDDRTRAVGREGIARARAALRDGRHARTQDPPPPRTGRRGATDAADTPDGRGSRGPSHQAAA